MVDPETGFRDSNYYFFFFFSIYSHGHQIKFFWIIPFDIKYTNIMASLQNLKAPTLMSKKTQKTVQADEDDVIIDATALPSRSAEQDVAMEEDSTSDKPNFAPASAAELKVIWVV